MRTVVLSLTFILALFAGLPAQAEIAQLDRVVAVVDDDVVTSSELERRLTEIRGRLRQQGTPVPPQDVLRRQVLERLVLERIQIKRAEQRGVQVQDQAVNQVLRNIAADNNLNLQQFRQVLERDGHDFAQFREQIRNEMLIRRLQTRQVDNRVTVTPQEVERFLENKARRGDSDREYQLSHILIAVPEAADPREVQAAREEAEQVRQKAADGADFGELAVSHSDGQQALEGGDLGWRPMGRLPTFFTDAVLGMEPGDVSEVIRSSSGFHLLKLRDRRGGQKHMVRQTRARHILIETDAVTGDNSAEERLERLRQRIRGGEDFAELARAHSDDRVSADKGGDLGWTNPGELAPRFEATMAELAPGEISEPFRSRFGWHIVQVQDRREHDNTEQYRKSQAREALRQRKMEEQYQQWVRRLLDQAYVEYRLQG